MTLAAQTKLNFAVAAILLAGALFLASPAEAWWEECIDNVLYRCDHWGNYIVCYAYGCCI